MVVQIDGLRLLLDANVFHLLFWFCICSDLCGTNASFAMNEGLSVLLFWNDTLVESSCSLEFSNQLGEVEIFKLMLLELFCFSKFFGNLIEHVIKTMPCLHNLSTLDLCICRNCSRRYVFGQCLISFFELFSFKCFTSSIQFVYSTFFILWVVVF